jgi:hypothetical protein
VRTLPPTVRPAGVSRPALPDGRSSVDSESWVAEAQIDAVRPRISGFLVLAATAVHQRHGFSETWTVRQYYGPQGQEVSKSLRQQLDSLPQVFVFAHAEALYDTLSVGGVARPRSLPSSPFEPEAIILCPNLARKLGWHQHPSDAFTCLDGSGSIVAFTMCWRDGVIASTSRDSSESRYGYLLLVNQEHYSDIEPSLSLKYASVAWRQLQQTTSDIIIKGLGIREEERPTSTVRVVRRS